jgi:hypothetical protein
MPGYLIRQMVELLFLATENISSIPYATCIVETAYMCSRFLNEGNQDCSTYNNLQQQKNDI